MCDLIGMSFNDPVRPNFSIKGFKSKGQSNPDGWGIAYYPDESAQIIKEPMQAGQSIMSKFINIYPGIVSKIIIGHVRKSSVGQVSHRNTHPFSKTLNGKEYVFAHNGSLQGFQSLHTGRFTPIGETDSEHAFCHILHAIECREIREWTPVEFEWLNHLLKEINNFGQFNCVFSDGEYLFCYHDMNDFNSYRIVQRKGQPGLGKLQDDEFEINLPDAKGYVIATNPLTDEQWEKFLPGELMVFKNGEMIFASRLTEKAFT